MSTFVSDPALGGIRDDHHAWIDVASDSMVGMKVRILVSYDPVVAEEAEIHLSPEDAEQVADAIKRAAAKVRTAKQ